MNGGEKENRPRARPSFSSRVDFFCLVCFLAVPRLGSVCGWECCQMNVCTNNVERPRPTTSVLMMTPTRFLSLEGLFSEFLRLGMRIPPPLCREEEEKRREKRIDVNNEDNTVEKQGAINNTARRGIMKQRQQQQQQQRKQQRPPPVHALWTGSTTVNERERCGTSVLIAGSSQRRREYLFGP